MKGKWSAFYLKAFPFVRERLDQLNPQFVCFHYQLKCSLSVGPQVSRAHVWVCFISSIFVILSCLVSRLPFNVNSLTIWLAICFGFRFQYKYIRSKEHAKLNKYSVSPQYQLHGALQRLCRLDTPEPRWTTLYCCSKPSQVSIL